MTMTLPKFRDRIRQPDGEIYLPVLVRVESRAEDGLPRTLSLIARDEVLCVESGQEFLVMYVNSKVIK